MDLTLSAAAAAAALFLWRPQLHQFLAKIVKFGRLQLLHNPDTWLHGVKGCNLLTGERAPDAAYEQAMARVPLEVLPGDFIPKLRAGLEKYKAAAVGILQRGAELQQRLEQLLVSASHGAGGQGTAGEGDAHAVVCKSSVGTSSGDTRTACPADVTAAVSRLSNALALRSTWHLPQHWSHGDSHSFSTPMTLRRGQQRQSSCSITADDVSGAPDTPQDTVGLADQLLRQLQRTFAERHLPTRVLWRWSYPVCQHNAAARARLPALPL